MKHILTLLGIVILSSATYAQAPEFKDLRILYADGNYEKLVREAEKYTLKEKTKKEVPPYFWMAKGLYKISLSGTDNDKYKNAYKQAIKFLSKGLKYDKKYNDGAMALEEQKFVSDFQMSMYETVNNEVSSGSFKRAKGWVIKYLKLTDNKVGPKYLLGACKFNDQDKPGARDEWKFANKELENIESIENWSEADKNFFKIGVLYSAQAMTKSRQEDKARTLVGKVSQWFENDPDWQSQYDEIVNGVE